MSNILDRRHVRGSMLAVDNLYGTAFTGEENAHVFRITDYEGSATVAFTGEIAGKFINPAGVTVPLSGSLDGDGRAVVTLDEHCYAVEGRFILTIWAGSEVIYCGVGQVMNSQTDTIDYPTAGIPDVAALIQQLQTILNNWPADYSQLQSDVSNLKSANAYDYLYGILNYESRTTQGITFSWSNGSCHVTGTWNTTIPPTSRLYNQTNALPSGIEIGKTYYVDFQSGQDGVVLEIFPYVSGTITTDPILRTKSSTFDNVKSFVLPANTTGMLVRIAVIDTSAHDTYTSDVHVYSTYPQEWLRKITDQKENAPTDLLSKFATYESRTLNNVTWTWNYGTCTVTGNGTAASGMSTSRFYNNSTAMPSVLSAGGLYSIKYKTTNPNVYFDIWCYKSGGTSEEFAFLTDGLLKIPADTVGMIIRLAVVQGVLLSSPVTVSEFKIIDIAEDPDAFNMILPPTNDESERTYEIINLLNITGRCNLDAGKYYVMAVMMPEGSTLSGVGDKTEVILRKTDSDAGFAIRLNSRCTVQNMSIKGNTTNHDNNTDMFPNQAYVNRNGIIWDGNYTAGKSLSVRSTSIPAKAMLRNLYISNFTGGGLCCNNTGMEVYRGITVSDCTIWYCYAGIYIPYVSEFNKFNNIAVTNCLYGVINNGGNNLFSNCNFSNNVTGFVIDNTSDQSPNNGHGSVSNCIFDHSGGNTGIGIKLIKVTPGEVFDGCQLFYSSIDITDSNGIIFTGLNAGWGPNIDNQHYGETINISGGSLVMFNGCGFRIAPQITVTNNNNVKFVNCYTWDGTAVEP